MFVKCKFISFHDSNALFGLESKWVFLYNDISSMEQHPVPQNVTTFQFRLIGDMTIKQFGYLAGGAILAYISYILPLPFFFTWPLTVLFAFLGIGFAFIPIEERPMDVWVLSFLKNVYSPTQFVWHRTQRVEPVQKPSVQQTVTRPTSTSPQQPLSPTQMPRTPSANPIAATIQGFYTQSSPQKKSSLFDSLFSWIDTLFPTGTRTPVQPAPAATVPVSQQTATRPAFQATVVSPSVPAPSAPASKTEQPSPELEKLQEKLATMQTELTSKTQVENRVLELQKEMSELKQQKQEVEAQLVSMKKQSIAPQEPKVPAKPAGVIQSPAGPTVKVITPDAAVRAGLPRLTTFPNVVTGIIKDNQGGLLPGVLVTVRDKEGIPLRALKTNKIGQFAASTQLPNGVYFVEVEDPRGRYTFDRAQFTLTGAVMPAIEIVAKSKRDIDREELVKQIFGQTPNS